MHWDQVAAVAVTLFFVMDPLGNIPTFNAILARFDPARRANPGKVVPVHTCREWRAAPAARGQT